MAHLSLAPQLVEDLAVFGGVHHHGHVIVVLRGGPHHRRTSDIDHLNRRLRREGVEVAGDEPDRLDAVRFEICSVLFLVEIGQDPAVDPRVEGLHPAAEHLR